ncbi:hypothetical protein D3C87_1708180 [compost metagenome]
MTSAAEAGAECARPSDMIAIHVNAAFGLVIWTIRPRKKNVRRLPAANPAGSIIGFVEAAERNDLKASQSR